MQTQHDHDLHALVEDQDHLVNLPVLAIGKNTDRIPFVNMDLTEDTSDEEYSVKKGCREGLTNDQKAQATVDFMHENFNCFSILTFIETVFSSNSLEIKKSAAWFFRDGGLVCILDLWWTICRKEQKEQLEAWIIEKAGAVCSKEVERMFVVMRLGVHFSKTQNFYVLARAIWM